MNSVTLPQPVLFVLAQLQANHYEASIVGGAVRDLLMGKETNDWDFTTNAPPEDIQRVFPKSFYTNDYGMVGIAFPQVLAMMEQTHWTVDETLRHDPFWQDQVLEITTYRSEFGYTDSRRPDRVEWGKSLADDLSRRDFTMNALALQTNSQATLAFAMKQAEVAVDGQISDPFGGLRDIENKTIRAVGNPQERFSEDALRMMRCIRFGAQLGFSIEAETLTAIQEKAPLLKNISWERIRDEFMKIIASPYPADGITLLFTSGLLAFIIPELLPMRGIKQGGHHIYDVWTHSLESLKYCPATDPIVRLAALLHDVGKPITVRYEGPRGVTFYGHEVVGARMARDIGRRLRLTNKDVDRLFILVRWHMFVYNSTMTDAAIRRFIKRVGLENINDMILLRVGDRKGGGSKATSWRLEEMQKRIGEQLYEPLSVKDLAINGTDIMNELAIPAGPLIGKILNTLFDEVMEDTSKNVRDLLLVRAHEIANAKP